MNQGQILQYTSNALMLVLMLSMPPIIVATVVGVLVSLLQALTQIQDQTLGFAVKLVAVSITLLITAQFVGTELYQYTLNLFENFHRMT